MSFFFSNTYTGFPRAISLQFPHEQIGLPQLEDYTVQSPQNYTDLQVLDGPNRRRYDRWAELFQFSVSFVCSKKQAQSFEGFYFEIIDQGMIWFRMPLSSGSGIRSCTVREAPNSPYSMTRVGTHYRYEWALEGYLGAIIDDEFLPPIVEPPDDVIPDFIYGGTADVTFPDLIDALTAGDNLTDFISGGDAQS